MRVVVEAGPAQTAGVETNDKIDAVNGAPVTSWEELRKIIGAHAGEAVDLTIERGAETLHKTVTPGAKGRQGRGPDSRADGDAHGAGRVRRGGEGQRHLSAGVRVRERPGHRPRARGQGQAVDERPGGHREGDGEAGQAGAGRAPAVPGILSAYLGAFNLLPFPALDGGRLLFLGAEAVSRRKLDAKLEVRVHAVGLLMLLTLIAFVTYADVIAK